jgi:cobalt-zinc-cadmium efflux system outer membrane protein
MIRHPISILCAIAAPVILVGCATVDPRLDYERVGRHVAEATGQEAVYQPGDDELVAERLQELLQDGITTDEAVQIGLLNNATLQAAFLDIGMARADVVQAGLLSNPSLGIGLQFPAGGGLAKLEAGLVQNIADLWQIPARKRAAERSLDGAILDIARRAADLAADAKIAYFQAVGADEQHRIAQENLAVARELLDLALTRQEAGAATELEVNLSRSPALDAELAVEAARLAAAEARRALALLLGVTTDANELRLSSPLPEVPPVAPDVERLVDVARSRRLDLRVARQVVLAAEARVREEHQRVFPAVELGVGLERDARGPAEGRDLLADTARSSIKARQLKAPGIEPRSARDVDTDIVIGPGLDLELPIFDQNQAQIAKAEYAHDQARKLLEALDRAVVQEVSGAVDRVLTAWKLVQIYRDRSVPLAQSNLDLSREAYRAGRVSFLSVLEAQRVFLDSRSRYVEAAQAAAAAVPELERTVGLPYQALVAEAGAEPRPAVDSSIADGEEQP